VASVPTSYVFHIEHSTNSGAENNGITSLLDNGRYSISNLEGGQTSSGAALRPDNNVSLTATSAEGLPFRVLQDPRLPWIARPGNGRCFTSSVFCWRNNNMPDFDSDLPLASGVGDLRRLVRNYGLPQASVFPSGPYFRGGTFGTDVNYSVPFNENVNNPKYHPEACVTTQA
jgi:hypothetical protein